MATTQRVQDEKMSSSVSGTVHAREQDKSDEHSSPESRRKNKRVLRDDDTDDPDEATTYDHPLVLCFAARNRRGRFYIPCKNNVFGGVHVENVLLDSGCSSLMLPFPLEAGFPAELLNIWYIWVVSSSRGTGAVHSPVLKISMRMGGEFACSLAGKEQPLLKLLRFHMGSQGANHMLNTPALRAKLDSGCVGKLNDFLAQLGDHSAPERTYALLGQSYLCQVMYVQMGDVAIALSKQFNGQENIVEIMTRYDCKLESLVTEFQGFDDLEDDDGDEDEEDYRLSWDKAISDDEIDEPDDR